MDLIEEIKRYYADNKKRGGKNYLHFTGRDVIDREYLIDFDQNSFIWKIIDEKNEKHFSAERREIIDLFEKYQRKMKTGDVATLLGKENSNVSKLIKKLVDEEILRNPVYGTYELIEKDKETNKLTETGELYI
jgi:DNA-binding MarR family transcriptional regulator